MIEKIAGTFRLRYHDLIRTIIMWVVADAMTREDAEKFIRANVTGVEADRARFIEVV